MKSLGTHLANIIFVTDTLVHRALPQALGRMGSQGKIQSAYQHTNLDLGHTGIFESAQQKSSILRTIHQNIQGQSLQDLGVSVADVKAKDIQSFNKFNQQECWIT